MSDQKEFKRTEDESLLLVAVKSTINNSKLKVFAINPNDSSIILKTLVSWGVNKANKSIR